MTNFTSLSFALCLSLAAVGCQSAIETKPENSNIGSNQPAGTAKTPPKSARAIPLDVAALANKTLAEFEEIFDKIEEGKTVEPVGEFRLYRIAGQSKGLAVRFYGNRAKSFNLISDNAYPTSKEALKQIFNIDVGSLPPVKRNSEPLTESYQGTFGGVKFKKVSAKREGSGRGFIFVLAEVAE